MNKENIMQRFCKTFVNNHRCDVICKTKIKVIEKLGHKLDLTKTKVGLCEHCEFLEGELK